MSFATKIGRIDDPREREADRLVSSVMRSTSFSPRFEAGTNGGPLDEKTRAFFESRFNHDFSNVRVHTDERAARHADAMNARAFSLGNDVFFGSRPSTDVIAHELAHVMQSQSSPDVVRRIPFPPPIQPKFPPVLPQPQQPAPQKTTPEPFFHGTTWKIAQIIPGNVQPVGGGDFGKGFYTHHDADTAKAQKRAQDWACRLSRESTPPEQYAGVIRFDVPQKEYRSLFSNRKDFNFTSTQDPDYAKKQKEWLDFVSGPGRGREQNPVYDPATGFWRHPRSNPDPDLGYSLIEGPFYRGVPNVLDPKKEPPRSAFDPYNEGTALPQQVVWNGEKAMAVLNASPTKLFQYDVQNGCSPVPTPHAVPKPTGTMTEDRKAREAAQREMTDVPLS